MGHAERLEILTSHPLNKSHLRILTLLSELAGDPGWVQVNQSTLAQTSGHNLRTVYAALVLAEDLYWLEIQSQYKDNGGRDPNIYRFLI